MHNKIELASRMAAGVWTSIEECFPRPDLTSAALSLHVALHFGLKIKESWGKNDSRREKEAATSSVVAAAASFVLLRDETDERGLKDGQTDGLKWA